MIPLELVPKQETPSPKVGRNQILGEVNKDYPKRPNLCEASFSTFVVIKRKTKNSFK